MNQSVKKYKEEKKKLSWSDHKYEFAWDKGYFKSNRLDGDLAGWAKKPEMSFSHFISQSY